MVNNIINQHDELVGSCVLPCSRGAGRREEQLRLLKARGRLGGLHFEYPSPHPALKQSPIDLTDALAHPAPSFLFLHFYPQKATIVWLNTTVYVQAAPITLGFGEIYSHTLPGLSSSLRANEVRIRTHSEHKVNGKYFDLELQVRQPLARSSAPRSSPPSATRSWR